MKSSTLPWFLLLATSSLAVPSRIWNGENARIGQAPYMVGLLWYELETTVQPMNFCGGAIINRWWVITAAHCLDNNLTGIGRFEVVVGQHFVSIPNRTGNEQFRNIAIELLHPLFRGGADAYDVALIRLDQPLEFNEFVSPISLAEHSAPLPQSGPITAFGWGSTSGSPPHFLPDELQTTTLSILANDLCREILDTIFSGHPLSSSCICTRTFPNFGNVCNADSGGPAVFVNPDGSEVLIGVLAWGIGPCSSPDNPSVWSGIAPVREWIDRNIDEAHAGGDAEAVNA